MGIDPTMSRPPKTEVGADEQPQPSSQDSVTPETRRSEDSDPEGTESCGQRTGESQANANRSDDPPA
jgi:hypothetical protein